MNELVKMQHGVDNILISDLVAEKESNVQIAHNPFLAKLLIKGIDWDWEFEHVIQDIFGVYPERGRAVSNNSWCAVSWGGNEYLMISTETLLLEKALDDHYQSKEGGIVMVDLSSAYECFSISGIAAIDLINMFENKNIVGAGFIINLPQLKGNKKLQEKGVKIHSLMDF